MKSATLKTLIRPVCSHTGLRALRAYQNHLLRQTLAHASANSPFYRRRFAELQLTADSARTIDELPRLNMAAG